MSGEIWLVYLGTIIIFMVTPGPSHLLMLANSLRHGAARSSATAAGDLSANALQMLAAGTGLAALLVASQSLFTAVKWAGVAYLVFMAVRAWRQAGSSSGQGAASQTSLKTLWMQGFFTSAANPKAVLFFAALFPQFLDPTSALAPQLLILGATYLVVDGLFLTTYGLSAGWLGQRLRGPARAWLDRIGALALFGAAILLGLRTLREAR
ncbi:MAG: LysE family translocator [Cohaesibacteraceae bacterium]